MSAKISWLHRIAGFVSADPSPEEARTDEVLREISAAKMLSIRRRVFLTGLAGFFVAAAVTTTAPTTAEAFGLTKHVNRSMPVGVKTAGLVDVYNLRNAAGCNLSAITQVATTMNLPPGAVLFAPFGFNFLYVEAASVNWTGWDLRGFGLSFECATAVARTWDLTDCLVQADVLSGQSAMVSGLNYPTNTQTYGSGTWTRVTVSGTTSLPPTSESGASPKPPTVLMSLRLAGIIFNYCKFLNTSINVTLPAATALTTFNYCYFNCFDQKVWTDTNNAEQNHSEWIGPRGGNMIMNYCCLDTLDGQSNMIALMAPHTPPHDAVGNGPSGALFCQGNSSAAYLECNYCVVLMRNVVNGYMVELGAGAFFSTVYLNGCCMQSGISAFNTPPSGRAPWKPPVLTNAALYGQNNVDETGASITEYNVGPPP